MTSAHTIKEKYIIEDTYDFERIFKSYSRELYFIAVGLVGDPEIARDAVQEAFVYLWEHRSRIRPDSPVFNYLQTVVRHKALDYLRKRDMHRKHEKKIIFETSLDDTYPESEMSDKIAAARRLLDSLPENCRKAFVLSVIEGTSYAQTASTLGVSVNTVKSQIKIAYRKVRELASKGLEVLL